MNKKALSEVVGYVLLIIIGISIASIVGMWLRYQVPEDNSQKVCPEDSSIIVSDYNCAMQSGNIRTINITLKNKGYFIVDGFTIKVGTSINDKIGTYNLGNGSSGYDSIWGQRLVPEQIYNYVYSLENNAYDENRNVVHLSSTGIYLIEVQPFTLYNGEKNFCPRVSYKEINKINCHP
jgi:hypothetical protein